MTSFKTSWFARLTGAALMVLAIVGLAPVEAAATPYSAGYAAGQSVGQRHGYTDGFKNAYQASYVDEILNGSRARTMSVPHPDYTRGYRDGYRSGYTAGWRSGRTQGTVAGREDARDWKLSLRERMRDCMRYGGVYCRGLYRS